MLLKYVVQAKDSTLFSGQALQVSNEDDFLGRIHRPEEHR